MTNDQNSKKAVMIARETEEVAQPSKEIANKSNETKGALKSIGGSDSTEWNGFLANQVLKTLATNNPDLVARDKAATVNALIGIRPNDVLESMMAAQMIAAHNAAMECYRRAGDTEQSLENRRENLNQANKLSRTFAAMIEALNRHRGKGQQKVVVEHVHVHSGGQAVVGVVGTGGEPAKLEGQPDAKQQIAYAPEPEMRREDEERDVVRVAGDA